MTLKDGAKIILKELNDLCPIPEACEEDAVRGIMLGLVKLEIEREKEE